MSETRYRCQDCEHIFVTSEFLRAPHPFHDAEEITGCPECREVFSDVDAETLCDEPGCDEPTSCGTTTKGGYRRTCYPHRPRPLEAP